MATPNDGTTGRNPASEDVQKNVKEAASAASDRAKQEAQHQLDQGREQIGNEMDKVAHAAQAAADDLDQQGRHDLSSYVGDMAQNMVSLADSLRGKNIDELVHEASDIARRNPALFITGSIAIGVGLSRFAKSSSSGARQNSEQMAGRSSLQHSAEQTSSGAFSGTARGTDRKRSRATPDTPAGQSENTQPYSSMGESNPSGDYAPQKSQHTTETLDPNRTNYPGGHRYE